MEQELRLQGADPFESTIQALAPNARGAELYALFDGRTTKQRISEWRSGRRPPPQWAIDLLRTKLERRNAEQLELANKMKTGPGIRAGFANIGKWNAANPR